jgi:hypothetical protein
MNDPIFGHDQGATLNGRPIDGVLANHGQHALSPEYAQGLAGVAQAVDRA